MFEGGLSGSRKANILSHESEDEDEGSTAALLLPAVHLMSSLLPPNFPHSDKEVSWRLGTAGEDSRSIALALKSDRYLCYLPPITATGPHDDPFICSFQGGFCTVQGLEADLRPEWRSHWATAQRQVTQLRTRNPAQSKPASRDGILVLRSCMVPLPEPLGLCYAARRTAACRGLSSQSIRSPTGSLDDIPMPTFPTLFAFRPLIKQGAPPRLKHPWSLVPSGSSGVGVLSSMTNNQHPTALLAPVKAEPADLLLFLVAHISRSNYHVPNRPSGAAKTQFFS